MKHYLHFFNDNVLNLLICIQFVVVPVDGDDIVVLAALVLVEGSVHHQGDWPTVVS